MMWTAAWSYAMLGDAEKTDLSLRFICALLQIGIVLLIMLPGLAFIVIYRIAQRAAAREAEKQWRRQALEVDLQHTEASLHGGEVGRQHPEAAPPPVSANPRRTDDDPRGATSGRRE